MANSRKRSTAGWLVLGIAIGTGSGVALNNIPMGTAGGALLGLVMAALANSRKPLS